jgi:hypothetical protein
MTATQARVRAALELRELTIAMRRQALAREHPAESRDQIEKRLRDWVLRGERARLPARVEPRR